jgi:hypothetical protein
MSETFSTKVHRIVCFIVDHDRLGVEGVIAQLENTRYANHAPNPTVVRVDTRTVEWDDSHPLNQGSTQKDAYEALFDVECEWTE